MLFLLTEDDEALLIAALHKQQEGRLVLRRRRHCGSDILDGVYRLAVDFFDHIYAVQNLAGLEAAMPSPAASELDAIEG